MTQGIHQSFHQAAWLAEGPLLFSEEFPETAARVNIGLGSDPTSEFREETIEEALERARLIGVAVDKLEEFGVNTTKPKVAVVESGLIYVCERLTGVNLENEIDNGNQKALESYFETLSGVTDYYQDAVETGDFMPMIDITGAGQFTWQDEQVVLHDISAPDLVADNPPDLLKLSLNGASLLNACYIGYEICELGSRLETGVSSSLADKLLKLSTTVQEASGGQLDSKQTCFIELVQATVGQAKVQKLLAELAYESVFWQ